MIESTKQDWQKIADFISAEKAMLHYVRFSIIEMIFIVPFCLATSIVLLWTGLSIASQDALSGRDLFICLLALLMGSLIGFCAFFPFLNYRDMIKKLKSKNVYCEAIYDFSDALPFLTDRIRLGRKFLFGKNYCTVMRYTDICRVYQYVRRRNFIERNRELHAIDSQGKIQHLCKLRTHRGYTSHDDIADEELIEVLSFMLSKNPMIAIGYRP